MNARIKTCSPRLRTVACLLLILGGAIGCEGEMGPAGPAGTNGANGQNGEDGSPYILAFGTIAEGGTLTSSGPADVTVSSAPAGALGYQVTIDGTFQDFDATDTEPVILINSMRMPPYPPPALNFSVTAALLSRSATQIVFIPVVRDVDGQLADAPLAFVVLATP